MRIAWMIFSSILVILLVGVGAQSVEKPDRQSSVHKEEIRELLELIRDKELRKVDPDRVIKAIQRLGKMRATEAIDDLIRLLKFRNEKLSSTEVIQDVVIVMKQPVTTGGRYPASRALAHIGKPSLPALLRVIERHGIDSLESKNATFAVRSIYRGKPSAASTYLKAAGAKASTPLGAERLLKASEKGIEVGIPD